MESHNIPWFQTTNLIYDFLSWDDYSQYMETQMKAYFVILIMKYM